ncbi:venom carboxylesterase-6-like [Folsomia candida]|uniref:venom carboxylesterase-6-like n=1 Tax=Folsomia candida TaxID=158441 RepID=UPI001604A937|nr:venom carboxylesterase-6-like [Folsomia candida]
MVLATSAVFLVQLLCVLVPCNPRYPIPDLSQDEDKVNDRFAGIAGSNFLKRLWHSHSDEGHHALPPLVKTEGGVVEGYVMKVVGGREVYAFEGLPYGEPPTGNLRFRSPVPKSPWNGILKAVSPGRPCLQYNVPKGFRVLGGEDCLFLNVYSPQMPSPVGLDAKKLPVIVFLHGGFLSSGDAASPGNWGLKDQALALEWISKNIESFGGDKHRITIMGQSAGSALVHFHLLSRRSRPFFHAAISMSGTAFNYWALHSTHQARNYSQTLAKLVGCPSFDSEEMVECLRYTNSALLVTQTQFFLDDWPYPSNAWRPCIEPLEGNLDPFLTESPLALYSRGDVAKVPWIVTIVSGEGYQFLLYPYITFQMKTLRKNWERLAHDLADVDTFQDSLDLKKITKKLTRFYFRNVPPEKSPVHNFANIITDRFFLSGIYKSIQAHVQIAPTYSYIFDVNGQYNIIENFGYSRNEWGVGHAEDLFYVFNSSLTYHGFNREGNFILYMHQNL